jgi:hypothetical protein
MVDLSLASSYVPAFVCLSKSLMCCVLATNLIPIGGFSALCAFLLLDRVFINSDFILDVNAVVAAVLWSQVANHERFVSGIHTPVYVAISVAWIAVAMCQLSRPSTIKTKYELYVYVVCSVFVSITYQAQEPVAHKLCRTLGFNVAVLVQIYWQLSVQMEEPLVLTVLRHGSVMIAPPFMAFIATFAPVIFIAMRWKPVSVVQVKEENPDVEAAVLREALANRKEKLGN